MNIRITNSNKYELDGRHIRSKDTPQTSRCLQFYLKHTAVWKHQSLVPWTRSESTSDCMYNRLSQCASLMWLRMQSPHRAYFYTDNATTKKQSKCIFMFQYWSKLCYTVTNNKSIRVDSDQSANKSLLEHSARISHIWNRTAVRCHAQGQHGCCSVVRYCG